MQFPQFKRCTKLNFRTRGLLLAPFFTIYAFRASVDSKRNPMQFWRVATENCWVYQSVTPAITSKEAVSNKPTNHIQIILRRQGTQHLSALSHLCQTSGRNQFGHQAVTIVFRHFQWGPTSKIRNGAAYLPCCYLLLSCYMLLVSTRNHFWKRERP